MSEAIRPSQAAGETRVPKRPQVWSAYAEKHGFADRMKAEEQERWEKYHAEREARQQQVLDGIAETFEEFAEKFHAQLLKDFEQIQTRAVDDADRVYAEKRLMKLFGTMDAIDKFFRMYLRARGQPEKITRNLQEHSGLPVGYDELESPKPKAASPEEARKIVGK